MPGFIRLLIHGLALLWTLLITALIGNVIASNKDAAGSAESAVNFAIFVAVLSWIVCLYGLASSFISALGRPIILLPLESLAVLFTFIAAIVLAAKLGAPNCGSIDEDDHPDSWIAFGSDDDQKRCREIQASTAFMWFLFASFSASLAFTLTEFKSGGSVRSSRPNMSQVGV